MPIFIISHKALFTQRRFVRNDDDEIENKVL
jgi:hypothetical protein